MSEVLSSNMTPAWLLLLNAALMLAVFSCFYWMAVSAKRQRSLERSMRAMRLEFRARIDELEQRPAGLPVEEPEEAQAVRVFAELQSSERAKVMKFNKLGKAPEEIAQLVGLPAATVKLLLKVQAIEVQGSNPGREMKAAINSPIQNRNSIDRGFARQESIA